MEICTQIISTLIVGYLNIWYSPTKTGNYFENGQYIWTKESILFYNEICDNIFSFLHFPIKWCHLEYQVNITHLPLFISFSASLTCSKLGLLSGASSQQVVINWTAPSPISSSLLSGMTGRYGVPVVLRTNCTISRETNTHPWWRHRIPYFWPFGLGIHRSPLVIPPKRPVMRSFNASFVVALNKSLKTQ